MTDKVTLQRRTFQYSVRKTLVNDFLVIHGFIRFCVKNLKEMFEGGEEKSEQPVIIRHHDKRSLCLRNVKVKLFFSN